MKNRIIKLISIILFIAVFLFSIFNVGKVLAGSDIFILKDASIVDKSSTVDAKIISFDKDDLKIDATFHKIDDYIIYKLVIKNNDSKNHIIKTITDDNKNANIVYEYDRHEGEEFASKTTKEFVVKAVYKNEVVDMSKREQDDSVKLKIDFENEEAEITFNPKTSDDILIYVVLAIVSLLSIIFIIFKYNKKTTKTFIVLALLLPLLLKAVSFNFVAKITNDIKLYDKMLVTVENNGVNETVIVKYSDIYNKPEDPVREGAIFKGWYHNGELFDFSNGITEDVKLEAKYDLIDYQIEYDLDGGTVTGNPTKYNVETESFDLKNPVKTGYVFAGWTGSNGDSLQTRVTIEKGSTGNKTFKANFVAGEDTQYKVLHKYTKLDGTYEVEEEILTGATGSSVAPAVKSKYGFNNPSTQEVTIAADGSTSVEYIYTRVDFTLTLNNSEDINTTFTSGNYPYETEIVLEAKDKEGYTFTGWSNGQTSKTITFKLNENVTISPEYSINTYTVTFDSKGGSAVSDINKDYNQEIGTLPETTKTGYTFDGWYTGETGGDKITSSTKVTGNVTYYAHWIINTHTITYSVSGDIPDGYVVPTTQTSVEYGSIVTVASKPTSNGYTFTGWKLNNEIVTEITMPDSNIELTGVWSINKYNVRFLDEDGTVIKDNTPYNYGTPVSEIDVPTNPVKASDESYNYSFDKWTPELSTVTTNVDYKASYSKTPIDYTITYNGIDGATFLASNPTTYNCETDTFTLNNPSKTGYVFTGWTGSNIENLQTTVTIEKGSTGNKTYQANFVAGDGTQYKVLHKYTKLDGTYEVEEETLTGVTGAKVTPAVKSKYGFNNPSTQEVTIAADGSTSVEYIYTRVDFTLTLNNSEDINTTFTSGNYPYETEIVLEAKDKEGYTFTGWSNGQTSKTITFKLNENVTISPEYSINTYTVTFDSKGGSAVSDINKDYNQEIGTLPETTKTGYTFDGWYTDETGGTKITSSTKVTGNVTYYAHWIIDTYTVTFDSKGGSAVSDINKDYNQEIGTLPETTKTGYTFDGWYTDETGGTKITSSTKVTGNVTYYAHWTSINSVARIGQTQYETLELAYAAVLDNTETTIVILQDISLSDKITIAAAKEIIIDLNGHNINNSNQTIGTVFRNYGTLKITDSGTNGSITGGGISGSTQLMVLKNETGGTVYIEGGTISSDRSQVVDNNGTMYITGGTLTIGNVAQGILNNNRGATLTMTGGTITSPTSNGRQAIYNLGTLNVSGNSVLNSNSTTRGTVQNDDDNAIFNFSGGTITSTNKNCQRGAFQNNKGKAYITGGTITSDSTYLKNGVAEIGGIQNSGSVLEIGTQGDGIDTTSPVIQGKNYGIYSTKNYSFYDGIIKGMIDAVNDDSRITGYESDPFLRIPETIDNNIYYTLTYNTSGASATYHITLNAKGGTVTPKSIDIPAGDSVGTFLPTPTNGTSTFDGWYEDEQYNTLVTSSTIPTADTIYYAKWS